MLRASTQLTMDALADGVVIADEHGLVEFVNQVGSQLLGVSGDEVVGRKLRDVLRLQDQDGATWLDVNCPYDGIAIRTGVPEQSWTLPSGLEVLVTARILRAEKLGRVTGVALSLRSGRGRARLDRERSDLVATVAHELRSPLTGVKGFVQALLNRWDKLNDDQKKLMLATVNADADRLSRLITELLDVARIDTGRLSLYPRPSRVDVLVARIVASVAAGTAREIETDFADDLPEISVDPDKFTQVVTNLVENGIRHGDGLVVVTARRLPRDSEYDGVLLIVDDEGEGIPVEIRQRVFTKFWKHGIRGGSGLGMYIVNGLTRAHGGAVEIGDSPSGGARIALSWPAEDRRPE
ncbi:PAS/PAC sensor signal transduction histidine kinase [metagenome]|uniref:histidine kinase n=1 Tax=metagenome TaxID=256318 RepID=A0A2P2BWM3_9ZZZZ